MQPRRPDQFAADSINDVKTNARRMYEHPDGRPIDLTLEQAAAVNQTLALNAIAAALLAVADAISNRQA